MTKLAGRCPCGVLESLAVGDEHLECREQRRCSKCGAPKPLTEFTPRTRAQCLPCYRAHRARVQRARMADPAKRSRHNEVKRKSDRYARRHQSPAYLRDKARKRAKYAARKCEVSRAA